MSLKMSTLTKESGVSKSTILYYIKEGLLPPPKKPKPNLYLYDDRSVAILKFIKYFQEHLHYSIAEIKSIIADNKIDFSSHSSEVINYLKALNSNEKKDIAKKIRQEAIRLGVDSKLFDEYKKRAKELAKLEYEIFANMLEKSEENSKNKLQKVMFDTLLTLKPYIFNQATIKEHKKRVAKNVGGIK